MKRNPNGQGNFTILDNNKVRMRKQCGYQANGRPITVDDLYVLRHI